VALKKRLIASLVLRDGVVVRSVEFRHTNVIHASASTAVDFFNRWAIDEIVVLDVSRDQTQRTRFYDVVERLSRKCFVPLTVGGWVTTVEEIRRLLRLGADKVTINTQACRTPAFVSEAARAFGAQCIVGAIDVRRGADGTPDVWADRGAEPTGWRAPEWARELERRGAGEIYLSSIDRDGGKHGYDLDLVRGVAKAVGIPVVAFGGAATFQHFVDGLVQGGADAVAAANMFHFTEQSTRRAKEHLRRCGIDVR